MWTRIASYFRSFGRDERGSIAVETVLIFPMLTWAYLATFVYFDAFRSQTNNTKAAYTISDALSRETGFVTPAYLDSMYKLQEALTTSNHATRNRTSVITYVSAENLYKIVWSEARGGELPLTTETLQDYVAKMPVMPDNEVVILYENWIIYEPAFSIGLNAFTFDNFIVTRPRFAPQLCYNSSATGDVDFIVC